MKVAYKFEVSGLVQGVGFRPFVYALAVKYELFGEVYNDDSGVKISLFGKKENIDLFENSLKNELPKLARIDSLKKYEIKAKFDTFKIIESKSDKKFAPILPDFALCEDCEREFRDPKNRRFGYVFINCTNCGPRFCIINSLPYDRKNTSMHKFKMCKNCQNEYENPLDRRYHAQPISCYDCGPSLYLKDTNSNIISKNNDALKEAAKLINEGKILGLKGLGGFHLVCNAFDQKAVATLRERKHRPHKPFAIMCKDLKNAKKHAFINQKEEELLSSNLKPIVLLNSKNNSQIAPNIAPDLNKIGIMLPFSGIHLALFNELDCDIVATSANISGEPVIYNQSEFVKKLGEVVDFYIDHDRDIVSPSDDSVLFVSDREHFIRTSRGLNPKFIKLENGKKGTFLALGAELKNSFAIYHDGLTVISPYVGDLKNIATFERFETLLNLFENTYELKFDAAIGDLHPHFLNLKYAKDRALKIIQIQHHHAHLLSVIFENKLDTNKKYLGFCFDGTGYGSDGKIWGGEVFEIYKKEFKRLYKFDEFYLLGGEKSIKSIYKIAFSVILKYGLKDKARAFLERFDDKNLKNLEVLYNLKKEPQTSSLGRIFDAFAAIVLNLDEISYEAQSGMMLEKFYDENLDVSFEFKLEKDSINFKEIFEKALSLEVRVSTTGFINGLVDLMCNIAKNKNLSVLISGGVFLNSAFLKALHKKFRKFNIKYYENLELPCNDSNIAIGQLQYLLME